MKRLMVILAGLVVLPAHALLEDVAGANYSYDSSSHLYWLDPVATRGVSFNDVVSDYSSAGWRHATSGELLSLFASNDVSLGGAQDESSIYRLITAMGGGTGVYYASGGWVYLNGIYDAAAPIERSIEGSTAAYFFPEYASHFVPGAPGHEYATLDYAGFGNSGGAALDVGVLPDSVGTDYTIPFYRNGVGHFLVNTTPGVVAPVPEPSTYAMMGLGLCGVVAASRRKRPQAIAA